MDGKTIVGKYGRIVIPKKIRDKLGIKEGTVLTLEVESYLYGGVVVLKVVAK